jgi:hypothetical protein
MKTKINVLLLFIFISLGVNAQKNIIKMHTGNFFPSRFKFQYERKLSEKLSTGAIGSFFMNNYLGYRIEPYARYYLGSKSTSFNGVFFQLKGHYTYVTDKSPEREIINEYGSSMCLGYEAVSSSSGLTFDFFIGPRFSQLAYKSISESTEIFKIFYCLPVDMGISVGYAF